MWLSFNKTHLKCLLQHGDYLLKPQYVNTKLTAYQTKLNLISIVHAIYEQYLNDSGKHDENTGQQGPLLLTWIG